MWDFAGQHVYHATHELFFSSQSLYVHAVPSKNLTLDDVSPRLGYGSNNPDTSKKRASFTKDERGQGAFKLTYDSSDEEDDDFFDSEQQARRARRALEQDIDEKLQFWIDCIQSSAPGSAILPIASYDDYLSTEEATLRCQIMKERLRKHEEKE
ncbi:hypothetical protein QTG54_000556 [Skeletonema marinoi]|uniref:Uncharacterized protein n=1 Tax=Skeletonema marinoi TaxID=267567 RepID=A0AAD9DIM4_9STRA|nr:hypothetical protein QTG54_000556 [Skeletonema marinoi]